MSAEAKPIVLIGQYDSPFVRRVGVTLRCYGFPFEHRPWSVWGDAEKLAELNPLRRVPTLVLEDGTVLVESTAIIDTLDERAGEKALVPRSGPLRRETLRLAALSMGVADKAVSLLYEGLLRQAPSQTWIDRCRRQINDTLAVLERDRATRAAPFWFGPDLGHADIAFACAYRFAREAHPTLIQPAQFPTLRAQAARCEDLDQFRTVYQPIVNNV